MIKKLDHYSMTNPASVYDEESLTALELAGRTAQKVNEVVEEQNELRLTTEKKLTEFHEDEIPKTVQSEFTKNLENGVFDAEINNYIGGLEDRVNNLVGGVNPGSTTRDAEIIDARTDADGNAHANLGESVRNQIEKAVFDIGSDFIENRLNPGKISVNTYVTPSTGGTTASDGYWTSDFIRVRKGERLMFELNGQTARFLAIYDSGKNVIVRGSSQEYITHYTQSGEEAFIRISVAKDVSASDCMVVEQGVYDDFIPYGSPIKRPTLDVNYDVLTAFYYNRITDLISGCYPSHLTGELLNGSDIVCTNYIKVRPGEKLQCFGGVDVLMSMRTVAVFDENGEFISVLSGENLWSFKNPNASPVYIRVGISTKSFTTFMILDENVPFFLDIGEFIVKAQNSSENIKVIEEDILNLSQRIDFINENKVDTVTAKELGAWKTLSIDRFPTHLKKNMTISATAEIDDGVYITVGRGTPTSEGSEWVYLTTAGEIGIARYEGGQTKYIVGYTHGLTYTKYITVTISYDNSITTVDMTTGSGHYRFEYVSNLNCYGLPFIKACSNGCRNVKLSASCDDFNKPVWIFGDSYMGSNLDRVYGQLLEMGLENYLICGRSGLTTREAMTDFYNCLNYGRPKYVVFYTGMNDGTTIDPYRQTVEAVKTTCETWGMTLILNKIPSVPTLNKEVLHTYIESTGLRYIDSYRAVGNNASWLTGFLGSDGIHPSEVGAQALANQFVIDVPEIMIKGR